MFKVRNYRYLLSNNKCSKLFVKPFKSEEIKEKLDMIFNTQNSKVDWANTPVHLVVK